MAENYMLILLLNVMLRVNWTGPCSYIFPLKPITQRRSMKVYVILKEPSTLVSEG